VLSFWKFLLLALVIGGVWAAVTIYRRNERQRTLAEARRREPQNLGHVKTVACRVCGTYVPEPGAKRCERAGCPF
jgi:hypothetical protein